MITSTISVNTATISDFFEGRGKTVFCKHMSSGQSHVGWGYFQIGVFGW